MTRALLVFGTRPEAIKLGPLIAELRRDPEFTVSICVSGQHREMLAQALDLFGIVPDIDLDLMRPGQSPADVAAAVLAVLPRVLHETSPDVVIVQGDTTTAFAAGLAAFYAGIDVAHVEAGLRSGDPSAPWPEEINRRLLGGLARFHFAPTEDAKENLLREGADPSRVWMTGNTVVDALRAAVARLSNDSALRARVEAELPALDPARRLVLATGHRRESFGAALESICLALRDIALEHRDVEIVYPVHLNPNVREPVRRLLGGEERIHLVEPVSYLPFVQLLTRCELVLTDSGGVQEEASTLGRPVLVLRDTTERQEGVRSGNMLVVGTARDAIVAAANRLLGDPACREAMSRPSSVFGDGTASARIARILRETVALRSAT